jgi:hypothetical protein
MFNLAGGRAAINVVAVVALLTIVLRIVRGVPLVIGTIRFKSVSTEVNGLLEANVRASVVSARRQVIENILSDPVSNTRVFKSVRWTLRRLGRAVALFKGVGCRVVDAITAALKLPAHNFVLVSGCGVNN